MAELTSDELDPIRATVIVPATPEVAFEVFTLGMGSWWDPVYTPDAATFDGIALTPEVGSRVVLVHGEDSVPFGGVTVWEPGQRYAQTFWLAMDPAHPSMVEVRFTAEPMGERGGTRVDLEHGGWTAENASFHHKYGDWGHLLGRYAAAINPS